MQLDCMYVDTEHIFFNISLDYSEVILILAELLREK